MGGTADKERLTVLFTGLVEGGVSQTGQTGHMGNISSPRTLQSLILCPTELKVLVDPGSQGIRAVWAWGAEAPCLLWFALRVLREFSGSGVQSALHIHGFCIHGSNPPWIGNVFLKKWHLWGRHCGEAG